MQHRTAAPILTQDPDRPSHAAILAALSNVLALVEQGLLQPPTRLTENGQRHVGETVAQAAGILERARG